MGRKKRGRRRGPQPEDGFGFGFDDVAFAVDFTEGGAPIGLSRRELRELDARDQRSADWAVAASAILDALAAASPGSRVEVGRACRSGEGLSRTAWEAEVEVEPDPHGLAGRWVTLLPRDHEVDLAAPDARVALEAELLDALGRRGLPFRVPRVVRPVGGLLVREWLPGLPLDLRAGRASAKPWEVVARVASAIHSLGVPEFLGGFATRRHHALAALGALRRLEHPLADEAVAWAEEHLPPDEPPSLLHGDLLGQNLLLELGSPPAVIDWEYATGGDPAYDLAIVTRGVRRPFQIGHGVARLIDAYEVAGGRNVRPEHVRIHELSLLATWAYEESVERRGGDAMNRFGRLARRVVRAEGEGGIDELWGHDE